MYTLRHHDTLKTLTTLYERWKYLTDLLLALRHGTEALLSGCLAPLDPDMLSPISNRSYSLTGFDFERDLVSTSLVVQGAGLWLASRLDTSER